jgi:hypothetical protein
MSHRLYAFGTLVLPDRNIAGDIGTAPTINGATPLANGTAHDSWGTGVAEAELPYTLSWETSATEAATADLVSTVNAWRALRGKRDQLYRVTNDGAGTQWAYARLMRMGMQRDPDGQYHQALGFEWQVQTPWYGTRHNTPGTLTGSPGTLVAANGGNAVNRNAIVTLTAGDAAFTALKVGISGVSEWTYGGTVAAGKALVVDCGAGSVKNDGTADYSSFARTANHVVADLLRLPAGNTSVVVTYTGGGTGATCTIDFYDTHE